MLNTNADVKHIIAGDFNFECRPGNVGYDLFAQIAADYGLVCCDSKVKSTNVLYTYNHETLRQQSWLDHFFVSKELHSSIYDVKIIDSGCNLSDHLPISCAIKINVSDSTPNNNIMGNNRIYR